MQPITLVLVLLAIPPRTLCLACTSSRPKKQLQTLAAATLSVDDQYLASISPKVTIPTPRFNIFQCVSFSWVQSLMEVGNRKPLDAEDLWSLPESRKVESTSKIYEETFQQELRGMDIKAITPSNTSSILKSYWRSPITRTLLKMYRRDFIVTGLLKGLNTCMSFMPPLIISRLLRQIDLSTKMTFTNIFSKATVKVLSASKGFQLSCLLLLTLTMKTIIENQYFDYATTMGASIRGTMSSAVFSKSLRLSSSGRQNNTIGEIVNFSQLDTSRMEQVGSSIHILWDGTFQVIGYTSMLLFFLGPSVLAGIAAMILIIPLNTYFLKKISDLKSKMLKFTDARVKLTNEVLQGVRAIKSYNWEKPFTEQLTVIRNQELQAITAAANTKAVFTSILNAAPSFVAAFTLGLYAILGNKLDSTKVFTALALFNQLRFPLIFLPLLFNTLADGNVSLWRLTNFLLADEIEPYVQRSEITTSTSAADIIDGEFSWNQNESGGRGDLHDVNLSLKRGELVAVVGPVGSGKSTLLSALLGELHKVKGIVRVQGRVAYVPQSSWIPNESIRNVILFGKKINWKRYRNTILACGLTKDLKDLESGDQTEIGEKGVNLSGGQKQRVSIARAVYDDADIYLFDDPLSALDTEVGMRVFRDCIKNLLQGKTRVLVTHQLSVLPDVDRIVIMGNNDRGGCEIVDVGTFEELIERGHDLRKSFIETASASHHHDTKETSSMEVEMFEDITASPSASMMLELALDTDHYEEHAEGITRDEKELEIFSPTVGLIDLCHGSECEIVKTEEFDANEPVAKVRLSGPRESEGGVPIVDELLQGVGTGDAVLAGGVEVSDASTSSTLVSNFGPSVDHLQANTAPIRLMTTEERGEGAVSLTVYSSYLKAAKSPLLILTILLSFFFANGSQLAQQWIIAAWTADEGYKKRALPVYLGGVTFMAVLVGFFNWARTYTSVVIGALASGTIHRKLVRSVLRAPLSFFESTPIGRLVQRFSKDLDQIDQQLPSSFAQVVASFSQIGAAVAAILLVTPSFGLYLAPMFTIYVMITNYYRNVARELKRLDSLTRSPIYTHFSETLGGLSVIRSFNRQRMYLKSNEYKVDDNLSAYYSLKLVDRWLCVRLETIGNLIVFCSAVLASIAGSRGGFAGISLNNALSVTSLLNWAVRNGADTESLMNSVERVLYTTTKTPSEAIPVAVFIPPAAFSIPQLNRSDDVPLPRSDAELLSAGWPWGGGITMENAVMSYRQDFEPVLKGVNISVLPGDSIGIVGRTGSGKSSLLRALLRLTELREGQIKIDGVDISAIGLDSLRSAISIIPQDPVLFSGTVRQNLDPFSTKSDEDLWYALEKSNLANTIRSLPGGLSFIVAEGGENFSTGQRQLLCLTRALIRRCRVLLLDEATSSVDYETDAFIQKTIRQEFGNKQCTILTIAHRLDTIMDSDRILVMDQGRVGEFDSPAELLKDETSLFSLLVAADRGLIVEDTVVYESLVDEANDSPVLIS